MIIGHVTIQYYAQARKLILMKWTDEEKKTSDDLEQEQIIFSQMIEPQI